MLILLLACAEPVPSAPSPAVVPALQQVKVALNWYPEPEFGGFYHALIGGGYRAAGLDVTILPGGPGAPVLEQLAAGQVSVAISGADDLLTRRARGLDAVAIFAGFQDSPVGIMVHAGGATDFGALSGRVAIEQGSPFQLFLAQKYAWGTRDGNPDVEFVPNSGGIGAFIADPALNQQGYITSEPCQAEAQGVQTGFLAGREAGWNPYASLAVVRGAETEAPWVRAFAAASLAGWTAYLDDPAAANAEIAKLNPNLPAAMMSCITARQRPFVTGKLPSGEPGVPGRMEAARWEEVAAALNSVLPAGGQPVSAAGAWREF